MTLQKVLLCSVFAFALSFGSASAFADSAAGQINGKAWTFSAGSASVRGDNVRINLWNQAQANTCDSFSSSTLNIRAIFPAKVGKYTVDSQGSGQNVMVFGDNTIPGDASNNIMADHGTLVIDSITDTALSGSLTGGLGFMNTEVTGAFTVPLCK